MPRLPAVTVPNDENRAAYEYLLKTRGPAGLKGGFGVMLASPEACQRVAHLGSYVRFDSPVPELIREMAATAISAEHDNPWEYTIHADKCRALGSSEAVVRAVLERKPVDGASDDEMLAINVAREMARTHRLSKATFAAMQARLGDAGAVDLLVTVGYFAMLAVTHAALEVWPTTHQEKV